MREHIRELEQTIKRLRDGLRGLPPRAALGLAPGWWVLALGEPFAGLGFEERDAARERLLETFSAAGLRPAECVWVWDEADRAQLVLETLPTREQARRLAESLKARGLAVRVKRAEP